MIKNRFTQPLPNETINLKFVVVGNSGVGKTKFLIRYVESTFTTAFYSTIGIDFKMKQIVMDNKKVRLQIVHVELFQWDTAGQERYRTITSSIYKRADGIIIVYDITDKDSFEALRGWQEQAQRNMDRDAIIMIIGNKIDRESEREVDKQLAKQYASSNNFIHMQVSAMGDTHVKQAFQSLARAVLDKMKSKQNQEQQKKQKEIPIKLDEKVVQVSTKDASVASIGHRKPKPASQFQCSC